MSDDRIDESVLVDVDDEDEARARAYSMTIAWSPEDDAYVVSVPELPGVHTHGSTPEDAEAMGEEVIALVLASSRDLGRPVAPPAPQRRRVVIAPVPTIDADRIRLLRARLGMSQREFAATLNLDPALLEAWERREGQPDGTSARMLEMAERNPAVFLSLIERPIEVERRSA